MALSVSGQTSKRIPLPMSFCSCSLRLLTSVCVVFCLLVCQNRDNPKRKPKGKPKKPSERLGEFRSTAISVKQLAGLQRWKPADTSLGSPGIWTFATEPLWPKQAEVTLPPVKLKSHFCCWIFLRGRNRLDLQLVSSGTSFESDLRDCRCEISWLTCSDPAIAQTLSQPDLHLKE